MNRFASRSHPVPTWAQHAPASMLVDRVSRSFAVHRTTDAKTRANDPATVGTPANLQAMARALPGEVFAICCKVEGFVVPRDGAWLVNGLWMEPGTERDLHEGDRLVYHLTAPHPEDDRPAERGPRFRGVQKSALPIAHPDQFGAIPATDRAARGPRGF